MSFNFHWDDDEIDLRGAWDETRDEPEEDEDDEPDEGDL